MIQMRIFVCLCFCLGLFSGAMAQTNLDEHILIQKDSPYQVFQSFTGATEQLENTYTQYVNDKSSANLKALLADLSRLRQLFDLSQTPPATRARIGDNVITYLYDILARVPTVNPETIPGYPGTDEASNKDLPVRWTIPDTDIQIVRIEDGPYSGDYQISATSVEKMAQYYERFKDLPVINERKYPFFYLERTNTTGPLIPDSVTRAFPNWMQQHYFSTPAWKIMLIGLFNLVALIIAIIWMRLGFKYVTKNTGLSRSGSLLFIPLGLLALVYLGDHFITQLNPAGSLASGEGVLATVLYYCLYAWLAWLLIYFLADVLVRILHILSKDYDIALIRLSVKLIAALAVIIILIQGADQIGIPALGIVAGFGVGGIAVALASQSTLENIFGGLSLFADRPFRVGDKIFFNNQSAKILRIGLRSTRLRTRDGAMCAVPNSDLAKMHIVNFTQRNTCYIKQVVSLRSESSTDSIRKLLVMIRERLSQEELVEHKEGWPRVQVVGTEPGRINISIRAILLTSDYSIFLDAQQAIMLDVLSYIEELDLELAQYFYKQT